ncbi:MAG: OmpH family outer membrane protein [Bacteroidetes bacterium]|nr:OmpH family outer membrane protein [Bacteroidota bacterium]MBS1931996.1 OmpH family outer membrane protein [Bacteroidota bacterium]
MKKFLLVSFILGALLFTGNDGKSQSLKIGVFDLDLMVQAMPGYRQVDSMVQIYEKDSLTEEYKYYMNEYQRLDSTYKADSVLVAQGKKSKVQLDMTSTDRQKYAMNLVYWQQISQNKSNNKRSELAQPLYKQVADAYKKILDRKKYNLILKPNTYEMGFPIDNVFISVAKELKLTQLPQELLYLGDDPDAVKQPAIKKPSTGAKKQ